MAEKNEIPVARVLVTGGTSGLGRALVDYFGNDSEGVGRGNSWDLKAESQQKILAEKSLAFPIFINYAFLHGFHQLDILQTVAKLWAEKKKPGLIINFGTISTYEQKRKRSDYAVYKSAVDEVCRQWSGACDAGEVPFRISNLRLGYLDLAKNEGKPHYEGRGVDVQVLGSLIRFIYENPGHTFPEIVLSAHPGKMA